MRQLYEARLISVVIFVFKQCPLCWQSAPLLQYPW